METLYSVLRNLFPYEGYKFSVLVNGNRILIGLKSRRKCGICPSCGKRCRNVEAEYEKEFYAVVDTIRHYFYGILNYFRYGMTNAIAEGFNTKINIIKRRAYGFRDLEYFMLKIYQSSLRRLP